jgi:hypothetical protein
MARTEVVRAVRRHDPKDVSRADQVLHDMYVIALDDELLRMAGLVDPPALRTLGAIHLASASSLAPDPVTLITYDSAMARAATTAGLPVRSPR